MARCLPFVDQGSQGEVALASSDDIWREGFSWLRLPAGWSNGPERKVSRSRYSSLLLSPFEKMPKRRHSRKLYVLIPNQIPVRIERRTGKPILGVSVRGKV